MPNGDSNLYYNNLNRVNNINDSVILNNNIIINNTKDQHNINLISNETKENNMKFYNNEDYFNMVVLDREQYINNMDKKVKNGTLLNNAFTSFYINKKSLKLNKRNKNISFINIYENINEINQDINKINKLQLLKDKNNNISTNNFSHGLNIRGNKGVPQPIRGCGTNSKNI